MESKYVIETEDGGYLILFPTQSGGYFLESLPANGSQIKVSRQNIADLYGKMLANEGWASGTIQADSPNAEADRGMY